jgi:hypothetical protein
MSARTILLGLVATAAVAAASEPADRAEGTAWVVRVGAVKAAGGAPSVDLHLTSRAGFHVNLDYPMAFLPASESTVGFAAARVPLRPAARTPCQGDGDTTCAVVLALPFSLPVEGEPRLAGTLAFSVCSPERCLIEKVLLRATLSRVPGAG